MDQYEMIRTAHRKYGKGIRELAREYGHHRKTIRKILLGKEPKYERYIPVSNPVMDSYSSIIKKWLLEDKTMPKKQRHTAHRIYERLLIEYGFSGAESTVRAFVRKCKNELGLNRKEAMVPLNPELAKSAEVDWGKARVILKGKEQPVNIFCMRSCYSGKMIAIAYPAEKQEMFFDAHQVSFDYFGGVFPEIVYDNLTTAVKKVLKGKKRIEQDKFLSFRSYYTFLSKYCNVSKANEKGGVEGAIGYIRRNFLVPLQEVDSFEELNQYLLEKCISHSQKKLSVRTDGKTIEERHIEEQKRLLPLPAKPYKNIKLIPVKINRNQTGLIDKNYYSVPTSYVGFQVNVHIGCWNIKIYSGNKKIAEHKRLFGQSKWQLAPLHYLELIYRKINSFDRARPIHQWRSSWPSNYERMLKILVNRLGENKGKREFVLILMLHHQHTTKEISIAIDEALELGSYSYSGVKHLITYKNEEKSKTMPLSPESFPEITYIKPFSIEINQYGLLLKGGSQ